MIKFFISFCIKRIYHKILITYYLFKAKMPIRAILHDLDKFNPFHFIKTFLYYRGRKKFFINVLKHKKNKRHHWEYWINFDNGKINPIKMDCKSALEMYLDWKAALKGYFKNITIEKWYDENKTNIIMNDNTRLYVENLIKENK